MSRPTPTAITTYYCRSTSPFLTTCTPSRGRAQYSIHTQPQTTNPQIHKSRKHKSAASTSPRSKVVLSLMIRLSTQYTARAATPRQLRYDAYICSNRIHRRVCAQPHSPSPGSCKLCASCGAHTVPLDGPADRPLDLHHGCPRWLPCARELFNCALWPIPPRSWSRPPRYLLARAAVCGRWQQEPQYQACAESYRRRWRCGDDSSCVTACCAAKCPRWWRGGGVGSVARARWWGGLLNSPTT